MSEEEEKDSTSVGIKASLMKVQKVGDEAAQVLMENGYTLERLAVAVPSDIKKILNCSMMQAKLIVASAQTSLEQTMKPPMTAAEYAKEMREKVYLLKTGANKVNEALAGGFKTLSTAGISGPQACLPQETLILTPKGYTPLSTISKGDTVLSVYNGKIIESLVSKKHTPVFDTTMYTIEADNGRIIKCSAEHKFATNLGFLEAKDLIIGDNIVLLGSMHEKYKDRFCVLSGVDRRRRNINSKIFSKERKEKQTEKVVSIPSNKHLKHKRRNDRLLCSKIQYEKSEIYEQKDGSERVLSRLESNRRGNQESNVHLRGSVTLSNMQEESLLITTGIHKRAPKNTRTYYETTTNILGDKTSEFLISGRIRKISKTYQRQASLQDITTTFGNYIAEGFVVHNSGKTQFMNELALYTINDLQVRDPENEGPPCVLFIETELNTLSEDRLIQMASARGWKYDGERIEIVPATRIRDVGTQYYQYQKAKDVCEAKDLNLKLIVVDSLTALFQRKYTGRELLPDRKQELAR